MLLALLKAVVGVIVLLVGRVAVERAWRRVFSGSTTGATGCRGCIVCTRHCGHDEDPQALVSGAPGGGE